MRALDEEELSLGSTMLAMAAMLFGRLEGTGVWSRRQKVSAIYIT